MLAVCRRGELVERLRACEPAEDRHDRRVQRKAEARSGRVALDPEMSPRNGPADDAVLRPVAPGDLVREEHAACERCGQAIGETEVGVGFRECGRDAPEPRREHHGPRDVPASAQDDVRPAASEDAEAREWSANGLDQRPYESEPEPAREARDRERVELESGLRNQPRLDAVGRPGERHPGPLVAQRFRDGERRANVPCGSSRCDQAHELRRLVHSRRC